MARFEREQECTSGRNLLQPLRTLPVMMTNLNDESVPVRDTNSNGYLRHREIQSVPVAVQSVDDAEHTEGI